MKKVKLMLLSLSILAVVGGALAFTSKSGTTFCTADVDANGSCPALCPIPGKLSPMPTTTFICTTPTIVGGIDLCHDANGAAPICGLRIQKTVE